MNTNITNNNINVSKHKKIINIIMILLLCGGIFYCIPTTTIEQISIERLLIPTFEVANQKEEVKIMETTDLTSNDKEFNDWYAKLIEKQELRKEQKKQMDIQRVAVATSGAVILIDGIAMTYSQVSMILAGSGWAVAPGILLVGGELIVIGSGLLAISYFFMGGNAENNAEGGQ